MLFKLLFNVDASGDPAAGGTRDTVELNIDDLRIGATGAMRPFVSTDGDGAPPLKIDRQNTIKLWQRFYVTLKCFKWSQHVSVFQAFCLCFYMANQIEWS